MKKNFKYLIAGIVFGTALTKGEAVSWYRIQEMFRFESFHMYGIFMVAVATGAASLALIKYFKVLTISGGVIDVPARRYHHGLVLGGFIFGCGWALTGACPGPIYALAGAGYAPMLIVFVAAMLGAWCYEWVQQYFPGK